jgi:precorrin-6Y C5,15-methyltransferase (decarboxylating)
MITRELAGAGTVWGVPSTSTTRPISVLNSPVVATGSPEPTEADSVAVIGIGADGWPGLGPAAQASLIGAEVVFGSERQLDLLPATVTAQRITWPTPLLPALAGVLSAQAGRRRAVLASGDPTFHGIAASIARVAPELRLTIAAHVSSVSLACARLGWAQQDVEVVSLVGRPPELVQPAITAGRRLLVLAADDGSPAQVAAVLRARGFGGSRLVALSDLGAVGEQRVESSAQDWPGEGWPAGAVPKPLTVLAIDCRADPSALRLSRSPGLPDAAYENDGQLTKRHVRAITLSSLAPVPGELLWDVGGGAGSIGIEWMRHHPSCRAISVERDPDRVERIRRNAGTLGVPGLRVILGSAPEALAGLPAPDAVFLGGGAGSPGLIEACWDALAAGGRLVVNVTTLESEQAVTAARARLGGELTRIEITRAAPIGRYTGWRPAMPVTQWVVRREVSQE